ncbi:MAG: TonB-dependent receptor [Parabacteroides sp.]|nr:TonB-dependent receptor [Parabacteroides sp.]
MRRILIFWIALMPSFMVMGEELDTLTSKRVDLDEVVVRSFKQEKNLRLSPVSASAVTGTMMRNKNITGIKEFSALIPNLFMPDYGSKLTSPVYIRGIGSKINSPSVGLYVDGVPFFEKSAFDFDLAEVDRIEVLRGPQGTLYGRNTMGGIINVYTKSPLRYQGTNLGFSGGKYANIDASVSHYGRASDTFGYALSADYHHLDGYFTNLYTGGKTDRSNSASGRIRLEWKLRPDLLLALMSSLDYLNQGGYPYAIYNDSLKQIGDVNYNDYSFYKRTLSTTGLTVDYENSRFSLRSQTAFQYLSDHQGIDQDFSPKSVYFVTQDQKQKMVSEEFTMKSSGKERYRWLFGAFGFWQGVDNKVLMDYKARGFSTLKDYDIPTYGIAVYHQSTIDHLLVDGLSLILGLRYDYEHASTDYLAYKDQGQDHSMTNQFDSRLNFSQLTPKAVLRYTSFSDQMFYGSVSKGYKTGGFNTSFEREEDRSFGPEYSWNYEVGTKLGFWNNRLRAEFSLFYIDWKHQQVYQPLPSGGSMLKNAGRSESKGIEISLQANPLNGLILQANYGYTHAVFKDYRRSETLDYTGNFLPLVPSHTVSLGVDYTISNPCDYMDRMTVSLNYIGIGKLYWNENNQVYQPYYGRLNGSISFTKGLFTLGVWAKNLTNTEYTAFYFESMGDKLAQKGHPFTIGGTISITIN